MIDGERKGMGYRSIYLDLDDYEAAQGREPDDGAGSMSSWHRIWVSVRAHAHDDLLRKLIRRAEDEKRPTWEIVLRALRRELAEPSPPVEVEPNSDDAPAEDEGSKPDGDV